MRGNTSSAEVRARAAAARLGHVQQQPGLGTCSSSQVWGHCSSVHYVRGIRVCKGCVRGV